MKTAFAWILGIGTLAGAVLVWLSRRNAITSFRDAYEVQKLKEAIAKDAALVEELKGQGEDAQAERVLLQAEIAEGQRAALLIASESPAKIYEMTDDEVAKLFSDTL